MPKLITAQTRIADQGKSRIIIIGGGFGGPELAKGLKNVKAQVVLSDRYNHHTFQPLLYQVATSGLETSSIVFSFRKRFARHEDFYFRLGEVTQIKPEENYIETSIGGLKYDYLAIATGAATNFHGMQDVEENAMPMKTITDSIKLRNRVLRNTFALDDVTLMAGDKNFVKGHPQMAQPAMQQGALLAKNLRNLIQKKPLNPFHYKDHGSMATVGRNKAVADLKTFKVQGFLAWCMWMFIHLISIIGFKNKLFTFMSWVWSYFSYDKSNRLIIGRPKEDILLWN